MLRDMNNNSQVDGNGENAPSSQTSSPILNELEIINSIMTQNAAYKDNLKGMYRSGKYEGIKIDSKFAPILENPLGLMLHSVGTPQPNASYYIKAWNKDDREVKAVHAFIDANTGKIYLFLEKAQAGIRRGRRLH